MVRNDAAWAGRSLARHPFRDDGTPVPRWVEGEIQCLGLCQYSLLANSSLIP